MFFHFSFGPLAAVLRRHLPKPVNRRVLTAIAFLALCFAVQLSVTPASAQSCEYAPSSFTFVNGEEVPQYACVVITDGVSGCFPSFSSSTPPNFDIAGFQWITPTGQ